MKAPDRISEAELNALVDGELTAERRHQVESWLADQPEAASRVECWRRQNDIIRAAFSRIASEAIPAEIMRTLGSRDVPPRPLPLAPAEPAIQASMRHPGRVERGLIERRQRMVGFSALAFMAGGLATLAAAAAIGSISHGKAHAPVAVSATVLSAKTTRFARRALEAQRAYAEVSDLRLDFASSDPAAIVAYVSGRLGAKVELPQPVPAKPPRGVRLTPGEQGLLAFVIYENPVEGRSGVMIGRTSGADTPGILTQEAGGHAIAWFVSDGVVYGVTGKLPREALLQDASALRAQASNRRGRIAAGPSGRP